MANDFRQGLVSKTIWPWMDNGSSNEVSPPSLAFSLTTYFFALAIVALLYGLDHHIIPVVVFSVATFIFLCSRLAPRVYLTIEKVGQCLSRYVGIAISWILLVPLFYIFFSFGRLIQKMTGRDPMERELEAAAMSYWQEKHIEKDIARYRRQF